MVEILLILALATKEIKQGKTSELISLMVEHLELCSFREVL
jgi:hypothetical protein